MALTVLSILHSVSYSILKVNPCGILLSNKNEQIINVCKTLDGFQGEIGRGETAESLSFR